MKENIKKIEPGFGLGSIKFGMLPSDILEVLGRPNQIEVHSYSTDKKDLRENWHYNDYELQLSYGSEDDWRLDLIAINSDYYSLFDLIQIGQSRTNVEKILKDKKFTNLIYEELSTLDSVDYKLITIDELSLNLWFDEGELSEIQWGPKFKDEETIIWPYQSEKQASKIALKKYSHPELFMKLENYVEDRLNNIFLNKESSDHATLLKEFPASTERENLSLEKSNVNYYLNVDNKVDGSMEAKVFLLHNSEGLIGSMSVIWDKDLNVLDDSFELF